MKPLAITLFALEILACVAVIGGTFIADNGSDEDIGAGLLMGGLLIGGAIVGLASITFTVLAVAMTGITLREALIPLLGIPLALAAVAYALSPLWG